MASWVWSKPHNDYYIATTDVNGNTTYQWAKRQRADSLVSPPTAEASFSPAQQLYTPQVYPQPPYSQSAYSQQPASPYQQANFQQPGAQPGAQPVSFQHPQPVGLQAAPPQVVSLPEPPTSGTTIQGAAEARKGDPENLNGTLDWRYCVQNDPARFFITGRVFSVLFPEPLGVTSTKIPEFSDNITEVQFGEYIYTQVRRFVVVDARYGFCYACPVSTYGGRATMKPGCRASEHAIIYNVKQQDPELLENERPLTKNPIGVESTEDEPMDKASRIRFGIVHPIQHNVKVKDLGTVSKRDMRYLISYYCEEHK